MRHRVRPIAAVAAALLFLMACGSGGGSTASSPPPGDGRLKLVVDTDLALDDTIALLYLASDPKVDLLAVTVSGTGEVNCPMGATIARQLLTASGAGDTPVACGRSQPLSGDREFPLQWREAANEAYRLDLPEVAGPTNGPDAQTLLTTTIMQAPSSVTVLTLGPLTNLAEAIAAEPALVDHLARVVIMGGAVDVPGNVQLEGAQAPLPVEWNLYIDPQADAAVVASGAPITLVALDATNQVPVTPDLLKRVAANDLTPATALLRSVLAYSTPPFLWDPLAAIAAAEPAMLPGHEVALVVRTEGDEAGRTVADNSGTTVLVVDPPAAGPVIDHLLRTLAGLASDAPLAEPVELPVVGEVTMTFDGTTCSAQAPATVTLGSLVVTVQDTGVDYIGIVAHLAEGATPEEAIAFSESHPGVQPPMVDFAVAVAVGAGEGMLPSPATVELLPGTTVLVCGVPDGSFYPAAAITVAG